MARYYYVYIVASSRNGTLYIGVTNNLVRRNWQHKNKVYKGFTSKYNVDKLVYFTTFEDINEAIYYEKKLKNWNRQWKLRLIEEQNPNWVDLSEKMQD